MKYEMPDMVLINQEAQDIITLSVGGDDYDPDIKKDDGTFASWQ